ERVADQVLDGLPRIRAAMDEATEACRTEVLTVQPGGIRREDELSEGLHRALGLRRRGVRMRDLYTHVARHGQGLHTYMELMGEAAEARTLDEVVERLIVFDRKVAFIPANADRTIALELRHPALVDYLVTVFERLWRLGIPLAAPLPSTGIEGITHRERSIAALLAEGHQDAVVAERLGISVRTCRAHIARLSETLGAASRTQLGVRIAQAPLHTRPPLTGQGHEKLYESRDGTGSFRRPPQGPDPAERASRGRCRRLARFRHTTVTSRSPLEAHVHVTLPIARSINPRRTDVPTCPPRTHAAGRRWRCRPQPCSSRSPSRR
ncbi:LuxR C-terminal-related transcriptional regulator, partial [Streptomyces sp. NPDC005568]|uniref:helix-turn-helix transcriptional regulator n=1 Tax=Streptomyces sp. NPDC005568 TaxID=3156887 RepID=UPI0033A3C5A1